MTRAVCGEDLRAGDTVVRDLPDGTVDTHRIDHLSEYPGRYCSGHARIAYDQPDEKTALWRHTCADAEPFHILTREG